MLALGEGPFVRVAEPSLAMVPQGLSYVVRVAEPSLAMVPQGLSRALNRESNGENRVYSVQCTAIDYMDYIVEVLLVRSFMIASIDAYR